MYTGVVKKQTNKQNIWDSVHINKNNRFATLHGNKLIAIATIQLIQIEVLNLTAQSNGFSPVA